MTTNEVLKLIRNHRGEVHVGAVARNDVYYVRVVKTDLLAALKDTSDNEVEARAKDGILYVDRA